MTDVGRAAPALRDDQRDLPLDPQMQAVVRVFQQHFAEPMRELARPRSELDALPCGRPLHLPSNSPTSSISRSPGATATYLHVTTVRRVVRPTVSSSTSTAAAGCSVVSTNPTDSAVYSQPSPAATSSASTIDWHPNTSIRQR